MIKIFLEGMYKPQKPGKNIGIQRNAVSKVSRFIFPLFKKPWRAEMFSTVFLCKKELLPAAFFARDKLHDQAGEKEGRHGDDQRRAVGAIESRDFAAKSCQRAA